MNPFELYATFNPLAGPLKISAKVAGDTAPSTKYSGMVRARDGKLVYIRKVIYSDPATIVFWSDDTKTVAKCHGDTYNREIGLMVAILKKVGGKDFLRELLADWVPANDEVKQVALKDVRKAHLKK